jgi:hypothetical protein
MDELIQGLDSIPWADLSHAIGPADDVPERLRALVSNDEDRRREALYRLMETIWHQGTIYEATSHVIPFLVRMLQSSQTPDRASVALLLASIAGGSSYLEIHAVPGTIGETTWREILSERNVELDAQLEVERGWVQAVREEVEPHLGLLYEFLDDEESELRKAIADALGSFPQRSVDHLESLQAALQRERDEDVRQSMQVAIEKLESTQNCH